MGIIIFLLISTAGVNTLLLPFSPSSVTMGFINSTQAEAILYNPANFTAGDDLGLCCFYNNLFISMKSYSLIVTKRIGLYNYGIAITNFDYGEIELRPDYPTEDTVIGFSANDFSSILSGSKAISSSGKIGINVKYINESIYIYSGQALALDISMAYHNNQVGLSLGATNLGFKITLNNEDVNLPAKLSLGLSYNLGKMTPSGEFHYLVNNQAIEFATGLGISFSDRLSLYSAMNYRDALYPGLGITIKSKGINLKYGTALYIKDLGIIHLFGIGLEF